MIRNTWSRYLRRWWGGPRPRPAARPPRTGRRLNLEVLEDRTVPSGGPPTGAIPLVFTANQAAVQGVLSPSADFYALSITDAGRLTATVHASGGATRLSLLNASGDVLMQSDGQSATNPDDLIDLHLQGSTAGTSYYLEVQGLGSSRGTYALVANYTATTAPGQLLGVGRDPKGVVAGDFNHDGKTDLAVTGYWFNDVTIYLGAGDGTFIAGQDIPVGAYPTGIVAGNFTGHRDGTLDLATANFDGTVSILAGNGDGTFVPAAPFWAGTGADALIAGNFSGHRDGTLDLAVANSGSNSVSVLLNDGHGTFASPVQYAVGANPSGIVAGNFSGHRDGTLDLATSNRGSDNVSVLLGRGDGTFATRTTFAVGQSPRGLVAADFNGDGTLDLATANGDSNDVSVLLSNGDGTFAPQTRLAAGAGPAAILAGDFCSDGRTDLAVANSQDGTVSLLLGRGGGTFDAQRTVSVAQSPSSLVAADFNGDGALDLAVNHLAIDATEVLLGNGDGTFQAAPRQAPGAAPVKTVTGDFNGDGTLDVAVADSGTHTVTVFLGNGDGTFRFAGRYATAGNSWDIAAGDLTGNGILDLVTADLTGGTVSVLLGNGDGTFRPGGVFAAGPGDSGLVLGDFNGDGHLDVATANSGCSTVSILFGDGTGRFAPPVNYTVGEGPQALTAGDFDHDGSLDLAVANSNSNTVSILLNNGHGVFTPGAVLPVGISPRGIAAGVFTTSGNLDLAVSNSQSDTVTIYLGDGHGGFTWAGDVPTANGPANPAVGPTDWPYGVLVGDFNGDGKLDVATMNILSTSVTILFGDGNGHFTLGAQIPTGETLGGAVGDFNGDGLLDIITANKESSDLSVILGQAGGGFRMMRTAVTTGPVAVATGDFNNNGFRDLVTVNPSFGTVEVSLSNGDGTFQTPTCIRLGGAPVAVAVADFNGDGRDDLAVADFINGTVSVLFGNGDGTFQVPQVYQVGQGPDALVTGDFDRDGTPDLAVANYSSGTVTILLARRGGTFRAPITVRVGAGPDALAVADLDGDGNPDLVVGDYRSRDVTVLLGDGQGNFHAQAPVSLPAGPAAVVTGDFNGDGVLDVAAACPADGGIFLLQGQQPPVAGPGGFVLQAPALVATEAAPVALVAGEFDGDGHLDLVVANSGSSDVIGLEGQGDGTFVARPPFGVGTGPLALIADDFNNDGRLDIVTVNAAGPPLTVGLGVGDATFANVHDGAHPIHSTPLLGDLNGDGVVDVAVLAGNGQILVRFGDPAAPGTFRPPVVVNPDPGDRARDLKILSVNGKQELVALDGLTNSISFYAYAGAAGFVHTRMPLVTQDLPAQLVVGDLNGDGRQDLIAALYEPFKDGAEIHLQQPDGTFGAASYVEDIGVSPSDAALVPLSDGPGPDVAQIDQHVGLLVIAPNEGITAPGNYAAGDADAAHRFFRAGMGPYGIISELREGEPELELESREAPIAMATGDFDGDGVPDFVVLNSGSHQFTLLRGDGYGGVYNPTTSPAWRAGTDPAAVVTGDFDGDGTLDLAILDRGSNQVLIYLGDGHGGFVPQYALGPDGQPLGLEAGNAADSLAVADVNHDGHLDLVIGNAQGDVLTLYGHGDGTFMPYQRLDRHVALAVAAVDQPQPEFVFADKALDRVTVQHDATALSWLQDRQNGVLSPNEVVLADLNGDGIPDLIVANGGGNNVLVFPGLGNGQFGSAHSFFVGTDPVGITVSDVNGDGVPDLVVANQGSNDVSVLFGMGQGAAWTLTNGPRLRAGTGPVATAVADVNGDGIPDILVANSQSNDVYLLTGVGAGFFDDVHPRILETGADPEEMFVGHFDTNAGLDLVTVNAGSNDLTFFPDFGPGRSIATGGAGPTAAAAGDFTADGRTGLVVLNSLDSRVALLLPGSDGPQLAALLTPANLSALSDVALGRVDGQTLDVYVVSEGQDTATRLSFNLDPSLGAPSAPSQPGSSAPQTTASVPPADLTPGASGEAGPALTAFADPALLAGLVTLLPSGEALLPSSPGQPITEFSTLPDQRLGVVVTLLLGDGEEPGARPSGLAPGEGAIPGSFLTASSGVTLVGYDGSTCTDEASRPNGPAPSASALLGLNAFITGSADALPERLLAGPRRDGGNPPGVPASVPELFDFSAVPSTGSPTDGQPGPGRRLAGEGEADRDPGAVPAAVRTDPAPPPIGDSDAPDEVPGRRAPEGASTPPGTSEIAPAASDWIRVVTVFFAQAAFGSAARDGLLKEEEEAKKR
jgi:hypothetical protein